MCVGVTPTPSPTRGMGPTFHHVLLLSSINSGDVGDRGLTLPLSTDGPPYSGVGAHPFTRGRATPLFYPGEWGGSSTRGKGHTVPGEGANLPTSGAQPTHIRGGELHNYWGGAIPTFHLCKGGNFPNQKMPFIT